MLAPHFQHKIKPFIQMTFPATILFCAPLSQ